MAQDSDFRDILQPTLDHALLYLEGLKSTSVGTTVPHSELQRRLIQPLPESEIDAKQVLDELVANTNGGILGSASGRFFAWAIGGALPVSLAADWLTSTWNQNAAMAACSPASSVLEEACGNWLKELLKLPLTASFALLTGCSMAHFTCLAAARQFLLEKRGWDVAADGLCGAPRIRLLTSSEKHGSIERAVNLLGLGKSCIVNLPVDEYGRLEPAALEDELDKQPDSPTIVVLQAGDLNIGAYDPFADLIPIARRYNAWVHIDGAFGLWAAASPKHEHLMAGAEQADSWATDGHKWLNVPFDCGYAFIAHPQPHQASMSHRATYLTYADDDGVRDQLNWNPEWSRRGRGVATYAALRHLGRKGVSDMVERCCSHAQSLLTRVGELPGAELVWKSQINQGLVRFWDDDGKTDATVTAIAETGEAFFSGTTWRGKRYMRVSVMNWQTDEEDITRTVAAIKHVLEQN